MSNRFHFSQRFTTEDCRNPLFNTVRLQGINQGATIMGQTETDFGPGEGLTADNINGLAIDPIAPDTVWAVSELYVISNNNLVVNDEAGVFRTQDRGENWTQFNSGMVPVDPRAVTVGVTGRIYVGTFGGGVFRGN